MSCLLASSGLLRRAILMQADHSDTKGRSFGKIGQCPIAPGVRSSSYLPHCLSPPKRILCLTTLYSSLGWENWESSLPCSSREDYVYLELKLWFILRLFYWKGVSISSNISLVASHVFLPCPYVASYSYCISIVKGSNFFIPVFLWIENRSATWFESRSESNIVRT